MSFLNSIAKHKAEEVRDRSGGILMPLAACLPTKLGPTFLGVLIAGDGDARLLTEMKRLSPSKGLFRSFLKIHQLADLFLANVAGCLSILTDQRLFGGDVSHLRSMKVSCDFPLLKKDFVTTKSQVSEAFISGSGAVLIVVALLVGRKAGRLNCWARDLGLGVIFEVNSNQELRAVGLLGPLIAGINNRNINTFGVSQSRTSGLVSQMPLGCLVLVESGIGAEADVEWLLGQNVRHFLVGERLMSQSGEGHQLGMSEGR